MELFPYKINVSVLYPPNTDTEGFKIESATMPEETELISAAAGLFSPEEVAEAHVKDIESGQYTTAIGLDGWMLSVLTAGAAPERSMLRALTQIFLAGLFRGIILVYTGYFYGIVKKCYRRRKAEAAEQQSERTASVE
ncbi:3-ketodihydrosphingosine reductase domain protein [Oesophagostomum dentatum]|uniref:3-ketodihydrosphingosine reductase domain protein n=1 Tax=Oesophagostomum dentatum TaxID=61180 RepID=A0A0B1TCE7_OESDE|nr:3-ketodihydrosphingosine reductase domain protein [Oesophagostomum dentatum]